MSKKIKIIAGKKTHKRYRYVDLTKIVGKTVEAIGWATVNEPCIILMFNDGKKCGFVLPME